ncbi:MAG: cytochrome c biogenesis CcdA family protein, partial [Candidatus Ornithospirochaeta sp.]
MGFDIGLDVSAFAAFLEGLLSFFSPCVLPLLPVYLSFLAGGNVEKDEEGNLIYRRSTVLKNSFFFILGIALTFFILSFGVKGMGLLFSRKRNLFSFLGGIVIVAAGLWQLFFYGRGGNKEYRFHINTEKKRGVLFSFLLGFTFSFSWTPCIGP